MVLYYNIHCLETQQVLKMIFKKNTDYNMAADCVGNETYIAIKKFGFTKHGKAICVNIGIRTPERVQRDIAF